MRRQVDRLAVSVHSRLQRDEPAGSEIAAGNASALFPEITPAAGSTAPAERGASQAGQMADAVTGTPGTAVLTAQVLGLIALVVAFLLAMARLSRRRRSKRRAPGA